jgi:hypothetical protein
MLLPAPPPAERGGAREVEVRAKLRAPGGHAASRPAADRNFGGCAERDVAPQSTRARRTNPSRRLAWLVAALLLGPARPVAAASAPLVFETDAACLTLAPSGAATSLVERATGRELLRDATKAFFRVRVSGHDLDATRLEPSGDRFLVSFGASPISLLVRISAARSYLSVSLDEVRGGAVEAIDLARLAVAIDANLGSSLAVRFDDGSAVALLPAVETVETVASRNGILTASAYPDPGLAGASVAIVAAPVADFDSSVQAAEAGLDLPSPILDGTWAKRSPAARRSYLFLDLTEANVDESIRWAKLGGFDAILIYASTWSSSTGSYGINPTTYPHGESGLARVVARLHAAGLRVGMHMLTSLVGKRDPLSSPRPDPRLLKDGDAALAEDLDAGSTTIALDGATLPDPAGRIGSGPVGGDVQIDDEIVRCSRLDRIGRRAALGGCERGANGTRRTAHREGARVSHLAERHGSYLADLHTSLGAAIAARIADLIERLGFDMIYLDAGEVGDADGPFWYWAGREQTEILRRVRRPILVQGSGTTPYTWHWFARGTCDDTVAVGRDAWLDVHKIGEALPIYRRSRMPAELGWWGLYAETSSHAATTTDEAELLGVRSVAFDAPFSVETTTATLRANPQSDDVLRVLARYEALRLSGAVSAAERGRLRRGRYRLVADGSSPSFVEIPEPQGATRAHAAPGDAANLLLFGGANQGPIPLAVPLERDLRRGALAERIELTRGSGAGAISSWLGRVQSGSLSPGMDLSRHHALAVTLDASAGTAPAVLDVQLEAEGSRYRDYLVDLPPGARRTIVVDEPSATRVIRDLPPAPGTYPLKAALMDADLTRVVAVNLRWARGADAGGARAGVVAIEALADR